ncbi:MAG: hypothetical protein ABSG84_12310 [Acidobacteriaceae bacterium]|jgi:hypothetical protein
MAKAASVVLLCGVGMAGVGAAGAGTAWAQQQPTAYTVTVVNSMMGSSMTQTIYRNGSKAVIDTDTPAANGSPAMKARALYDLSAHTNEAWNLADSSGGCSSGTFSGDWGDPFAGLADVSTGKLTGTETVNGFATKVYAVDAGGGATAKVWVDTKTGLPVKVDVTQGTTTQTISQVTKFTVGAPPASVFVIPANCTAAGGPPPPSQRDKDIAAETGSNVGDFVDAVMTTAPGPQDTCSVAIRVMKAVSMTPITSGFTLSADTLDDQNNPVPGGKLTVTAGANGVWRIANVPARFDMSEDFGNAGGGGGTLRRQCWGPVSTLLLVVKDPTKLGLGADWLWDVKGKYGVK